MNSSCPNGWYFLTPMQSTHQTLKYMYTQAGNQTQPYVYFEASLIVETCMQFVLPRSGLILYRTVLSGQTLSLLVVIAFWGICPINSGAFRISDPNDKPLKNFSTNISIG